ncbi:hypothetical protein BC829DRAFT_251246 [Chytridium lagenaria]|nr:hypothetical protein BC829DRAFT_251246 [Chytridium lagenaria]
MGGVGGGLASAYPPIISPAFSVMDSPPSLNSTSPQVDAFSVFGSPTSSYQRTPTNGVSTYSPNYTDLNAVNLNGMNFNFMPLSTFNILHPLILPPHRNTRISPLSLGNPLVSPVKSTVNTNTTLRPHPSSPVSTPTTSRVSATLPSPPSSLLAPHPLTAGIPSNKPPPLPPLTPSTLSKRTTATTRLLLDRSKPGPWRRRGLKLCIGRVCMDLEIGRRGVWRSRRVVRRRCIRGRWRGRRRYGRGVGVCRRILRGG